MACKPKAFWFHYNKPESRKQQRNVLTVHVNGGCNLVHAIDCSVPLKTRDRKQQPRCVLSGRGFVSFRTGDDGSITAIIRGKQ